MKTLLNKLLEAQTLSYSEAFELMHGIAGHKLNNAQIAAVLSSFIIRSISLEELTGFRRALLELAIKPDLNQGDLIDLCGTGGDGKNTFNISTLSAFVVAGAGIPVAKHGNYGVSSNSGSSNVMEHFGYRFSNDEDKLKRELDKTGITFLHAPLFHPALKAAGPVRKELGVKSFFNILGPLVNPSEPDYQASGVFNLETGRIYSYLLQKESKGFMVVHSLDGYDEISLTSDTRVFSRNGEDIITAADLGLNQNKPEDLYGGESVEDAAVIFLKVLKNEASGPQKSVVVANSAIAIKCYKNDLSFREAVALADETLSSGRAFNTFKNLTELQ